MTLDQYRRAKAFFGEAIDIFADRYPKLSEINGKMFKVLHAFEDKLPLIDVLLERELLAGVLLKKSSSQIQTEIVGQIEQRMREQGLPCMTANTTYASRQLFNSITPPANPIIFSDHGGYFSPLASSLKTAFGSEIIGVTEHTLNGEERLVKKFSQQIGAPYLSTARLDLKDRSDREIARAIAWEIVATCDHLDRALLSQNSNLRVLIVGYGTMGSHATQELQKLGCTAELIVVDIQDKKLAFAAQDQCQVSRSLESVIPTADVIILATNVINGEKPVLNPKLLSLAKSNVLITSMTSMDDEIRMNELTAQNIIKKTGSEQTNSVYSGPSGKPIFFMHDGKPANVGLKNGGARESVYLVEAAGLAGGFNISQNGQKFEPNKSHELPDEDGQILAGLWVDHFAELVT